MSARLTPLTWRFLGAVVGSILILALVLLALRTGGDDGTPTPTGSPSAAAAPDGDTATDGDAGTSDGAAGGETDDGGADDAAALALLRDPDAADAAPTADLLAAARRVGEGAWDDLSAEVWDDTLDTSRPVYVADVTVDPARRRVEGVVTIASPALSAGDDGLVLRFLATASAITEPAGLPSVTVALDGVEVPVELDGDGARLVVPPASLEVAGRGDLAAAPGPATLRVAFAYDVPDRVDIVDDGGPAGFGLLARNREVTMLGHFLPLLTFEPGPMLAWGDVGSFPVATFSVTIHHDGVLVTGGVERSCDGDGDTAARPADGCTWAVGTALRDLVVAVLDDDATIAQDGAVRTIGGADLRPDRAAEITAETVDAMNVLTDLFGPVAWPDLEVVMAPLSSNAAGMEFPGLVIVRDDLGGSLDGGFGTYVIAHEAAHQWFHALLGNGSLSDPVVDESLAQYASVLFYAEAFGSDAADALVARYYQGRYDGFRASGARDVPPASELASFGSSDVYGPMVYARGALAWLAAEDVVGRATVVGFVGDLVRVGGLGRVTARDVVALAEERDGDLAAALERWWFDPEPVSRS